MPEIRKKSVVIAIAILIFSMIPFHYKDSDYSDGLCTRGYRALLWSHDETRVVTEKDSYGSYTYSYDLIKSTRVLWFTVSNEISYGHLCTQ